LKSLDYDLAPVSQVSMDRGKQIIDMKLNFTIDKEKFQPKELEKSELLFYWIEGAGGETVVVAMSLCSPFEQIVKKLNFAV